MTSARRFRAQRKPATVRGSGSGSDQREAACVGDSRERDGRARSARGGQGGLSVPKPPRGARPAARGALTPYAFRLPRTPHEHAAPHAHSTRDPRAGPSGDSQFPDRLSLARLGAPRFAQLLKHAFFQQVLHGLAAVASRDAIVVLVSHEGEVADGFQEFLARG